MGRQRRHCAPKERERERDELRNSKEVHGLDAPGTGGHVVLHDRSSRFGPSAHRASNTGIFRNKAHTATTTYEGGQSPIWPKVTLTNPTLTKTLNITYSLI